MPTKTRPTRKREARQTILVTGASGFLGRHLVSALLAQDDRPLRLATTSEAGAATFPQSKRIQPVVGSILDPSFVRQIVAGAQEIYHLAGRVSRCIEDARAMYALHVEGTRHLIDAAKRSGVQRIVLASTSGTIAVSETPEPIPDERSPAPLRLIGRWPYYASKLYQEQLALRLCGDGPELCVLNPSLLLGPGDDKLSSTHDILRYLQRDIPIVPRGGLNFVDARDVAQAFVGAMRQGQPGERYLLGGPNWSFRQFFGRLERMTKIPAPRLSPPKGIALWAARAAHGAYRLVDKEPAVDLASAQMAAHYWYLDDAKARGELDFKTRDPRETLYDTVRYLQQRFGATR